jgi:Ca2+-binding RTX toxin-like protein
MTSASIIGGGYVKEVLSAAELKLVQAALASAAGTKTVHILNSTSAAAITGTLGGDYNVYNPSATSGAVYNLPTDGDVIIVGGPVPAGGKVTGGVTINGHAGQEILVGELSNNTFNANGGSGYVFAGSGANVINTNVVGLAGGPLDIVTGAGKDVINTWGGAITVAAAGVDTVNVLAGSNTIVGSGTLAVTVSAGASATVDLTTAGATDAIKGDATIDLNHINAYRLTLNGNDTISFGSSSDTITSKGTATVQSSSSGVTVSAGGSDSAAVGTTAATLIAGSGASTLAGGTASNVFMGGKGKDTLIANTGASSNLFDFTNTTPGGKHTITNFVTGQDHIHLVGYTAGDVATALANAHLVGGNTVTNLADGTTITLTGYNHLTASDFN